MSKIPRPTLQPTNLRLFLPSIFTLLSWFKRKLSRLISPHEIYFICKTTFLVRLHLQSNDGFYFNDYNTTYPVGVFPERELRQITNSRIWMNCSEWDMLWTDRRHRMRFVVYVLVFILGTVTLHTAVDLMLQGQLESASNSGQNVKKSVPAKGLNIFCAIFK